MYSYPSYRKFFCDVGAKTALFFWENYPSPQYLKVLTVEELAAELRQASRNSCSVRKAQQIFDLVGDGDTKRDYQSERDFIVKSIVQEIRYKIEQLQEVDAELKRQQGMEYLNKIINDPNATFTVRDTNAFGKVLDVRLPDGMVARWTVDGQTFIGFLERFTMK